MLVDKVSNFKRIYETKHLFTYTTSISMKFGLAQLLPVIKIEDKK